MQLPSQRVASVTPPLEWVGSRRTKGGQNISGEYFYVHNEIQVAMAWVDAEAAAAAATQRSILSSGMFPDFSPSVNGCYWDSTDHILPFFGSNVSLGYKIDIPGFSRFTSIQILAVESCAGRRNVFFASSDNLEFSKGGINRSLSPIFSFRRILILSRVLSTCSS
jgi:hypothetical protein